MRQKIVAGNWKMNLLSKDAMEVFNYLLKVDIQKDVKVMIFPPAIYLQKFCELTNERIIIGAQNFFPKESGAYTGEISISQMKSIGVSSVLVGHSERRAYFGEHHEFLKEKVNAAIEHGINLVFCCGEPLDVRESGKEMAFVEQQLEESLFHLGEDEIVNCIIAYEPVWAIGTGKTATSAQAEEMHRSIRKWLADKYGQNIANHISILYGGSCNLDNAEELFDCPNVDGGLIGGASLNPESFIGITKSY
jgi:triosephosphate isomerase